MAHFIAPPFTCSNGPNARCTEKIHIRQQSCPSQECGQSLDENLLGNRHVKRDIWSLENEQRGGAASEQVAHVQCSTPEPRAHVLLHTMEALQPITEALLNNYDESRFASSKELMGIWPTTGHTQLIESEQDTLELGLAHDVAVTTGLL